MLGCRIAIVLCLRDRTIEASADFRGFFDNCDVVPRTSPSCIKNAAATFEAMPSQTRSAFFNTLVASKIRSLMNSESKQLEKHDVSYSAKLPRRGRVLLGTGQYMATSRQQWGLRREAE